MSILEIELIPEMEQQVQEGNVPKPKDEMRRNVMDFYGIGRDVWADSDVQRHINEMRAGPK